MDALLALIVLFALLAAIVSLLNPRWTMSWSPTPTRLKAVAFYLGVMLVAAIALGPTSPDDAVDSEGMQTEAEAPEPEATPERAEAPEPEATPERAEAPEPEAGAERAEALEDGGRPERVGSQEISADDDREKAAPTGAELAAAEGQEGEQGDDSGWVDPDIINSMELTPEAFRREYNEAIAELGRGLEIPSLDFTEVYDTGFGSLSASRLLHEEGWLSMLVLKHPDHSGIWEIQIDAALDEAKNITRASMVYASTLQAAIMALADVSATDAGNILQNDLRLAPDKADSLVHVSDTTVGDKYIEFDMSHGEAYFLITREDRLIP